MLLVQATSDAFAKAAVDILTSISGGRKSLGCLAPAGQCALAQHCRPLHSCHLQTASYPVARRFVMLACCSPANSLVLWTAACCAVSSSVKTTTQTQTRAMADSLALSINELCKGVDVQWKKTVADALAQVYAAVLVAFKNRGNAQAAASIVGQVCCSPALRIKERLAYEPTRWVCLAKCSLMPASQSMVHGQGGTLLPTADSLLLCHALALACRPSRQP